MHTHVPAAPCVPRARTGPRFGRAPWFVLLAALSAGPACAEPSGGLPGATLESVLAIAERVSPELMGRAHETAAAQARVAIAGSLADPMVQITSESVDRKLTYSVQQDFPLWGKRDLQRQMAEATVSEMVARTQGVAVQLREKVKVAFAQYYAANRSLLAMRDQRRAVDAAAEATRTRYAQSRGSLQDVLKAEIAATRIATDIVRAEAALHGAEGQLNALLNRPAAAPLAKPDRLRALPDQAKLDMPHLVERAQAANPALVASAATISGADSGRKLAERNWYPDVTVGAGYVDRTINAPTGYMVSVGVKVPLQWGLHEAQTREASAQLNASRAQRGQLEQQINSDLAQTVAALEGSAHSIDLLRRQLLPRTETLVRSASSAFSVGSADLGAVLEAQRDLADLRVQLLAMELDGQRQLAALESLIGGEL